MNSLVKYTISVLLLMAGLLLIFWKGQVGTSEVQNIHSTEAMELPEDVGEVSIPLRSESIHLPVSDEDTQKIQPLFLLEPTVCLSCLNNLTDYRNLFEQDPIFNDAILVFMNEDKEDVERFIYTSELDFEYLITDSTSIDARLRRKPLQKLLFLDPESQKVFFNEPIPNAATSIESKSHLLARMDSLWTITFQ